MRSSNLSICLNYSLWIFQGFSLFSYQCSCSLFFSNFDILAYLLLFVNNFFILFSVVLFLHNSFVSLAQSVWIVNNFFYFLKFLRFGTLQFNAVLKTTFVKYHKCYCLSSSFHKFLRKSGEGGIWTLAPVSRPIPLAGAPLRPLEYFSKGIS